VDQVSYVRFASVYRQFKTLEEMIDDAKAVIDAQRFEDPAQGVLFLDDKKPALNGDPDQPAKPRARRGRKPGATDTDARDIKTGETRKTKFEAPSEEPNSKSR
jgi:hypothetical protein